MKTDADYDYEYVAFNCAPTDHDIDPDSQYAWLFTMPIRIFGIGPNALQQALIWVDEQNRLRNEARRATGRGIEVDNYVGEFINTEVRRQLIIKLGYQRMEDTDHPSGYRIDMIDEVNRNWVPA